MHSHNYRHPDMFRNKVASSCSALFFLQGLLRSLLNRTRSCFLLLCLPNRCSGPSVLHPVQRPQCSTSGRLATPPKLLPLQV